MPARRHPASRLVFCLILLGVLAPAPAAARAEACFAETSFCVQGRFLDYWLANGGLARNGFPLGEERREILEDGNEYTVQYFERVRLEYHPKNAPPYDVLLGQFGRRALLRTYDPRFGPSPALPVAPKPGQVYFPETGHNLAEGFLAYWRANGGLAQFGYPITEERREYLPVGAGSQEFTVQYFERARFEYHPENPAPYEVLLGQFGRQILAENDRLRGNADFFAVYIANERLQLALRAPQDGPGGAVVETPGATQRFQGGRMLFLERSAPYNLPGYDPANPKGIYVLCGDAGVGRWYPFADTWVPGEPAGGGPGPGPGLHEPRLGFYKVWSIYREVRDCLGFATDPDGRALPLVWQKFPGGQLLLVETEEGRSVYALTHGIAGNGGAALPGGAASYERFPAPRR